jgi:hypothetical protein
LFARRLIAMAILAGVFLVGASGCSDPNPKLQGTPPATIPKVDPAAPGGGQKPVPD